ncbi:MAG: hypothetical protein AAF184_13260, partial [Pseudomonadota bacterium]
MRTLLLSLTASLLLLGCESSDPSPPSDDPNVKPNQGEYDEDRAFISPPTLLHPVYACATNVAVKHFIKDALIEVYLNGDPTPIASAVGQFPSLGVNIDTGVAFVVGQVLTATQTVNGFTSAPSNAVTVTSHLEDYPAGLPQPRINAPPVWECGRAAGVSDVVPGALV